VAAVSYRYELRQGTKIIATGHLNADEHLQVDSQITVAGHQGVISAIEPTLRSREHRLVIQILRVAVDHRQTGTHIAGEVEG
jgi:hypothetical protein